MWYLPFLLLHVFHDMLYNTTQVAIQVVSINILNDQILNEIYLFWFFMLTQSFSWNVTMASDVSHVSWYQSVPTESGLETQGNSDRNWPHVLLEPIKSKNVTISLGNFKVFRRYILHLWGSKVLK